MNDRDEITANLRASALTTPFVAYAVVALRSSAAYVRPITGFDDIGSAVAIAAIRKNCRSDLSSMEHTPHAHEP